MRIQHNIAAMNSYRNYTNNVSAVNKNLEKLSSGYKINRAGDDAAGLAISEKMRAQITGLQTAQKNAKDGISLVKTAEGALQEVHDMLNRMVTLATQSANGTYDNEVDRANLQKEVDQLRAEINRIADSSNFNGIKLLDGSMDGAGKFNMSGSVNTTDAAMEFTVLRDGQQSVSEPAAGVYSIDFSGFSITNNDKTQDATVTFTLATGVTADVTVNKGSVMDGAQFAQKLMDALDEKGTNPTSNDKKITIDGNTYTMSVTGSKLTLTMDEIPSADVTTKFEAKISTPNPQTGWKPDELTTNGAEQLQVTPEVEAVTNAGRAYGQAQFNLIKAIGLTTNSTYGDLDGKAIQIGKETYVFATTDASKERFGGVSGAKVIDFTDKAKGTKIDETLISQRLAKAAENNSYFKVGSNVGTSGDSMITLTEKEGAIDYKVNNLAGVDGKSKQNGATSAAIDATSADWLGLVKAGSGAVTTSSGASSLTLQIGDTSDSYNQMKVNIQDCHAKAIGIGDIDISSQTSAQAAVEKIKSAINYVSDVRGTLGATQNRLEHTINNLSVMAENIQDAESTIRDTDIAEEMMAYTKNNILVQSAQAMLAQANQIPQGVLQLLG